MLFKTKSLLLIIVLLLLNHSISSKVHTAAKIKKLKSGMGLKATETQASNVCSNSYFGIPAACLSSEFTTTSSQGAFSSVLNTFGFFFEVLMKVGLEMDVCLGDATGSVLTTSSNLQYMKCNAIPLVQTNTFGAVGAYIENFICPAFPTAPQTIGGCIVFDTCGTVAISITGGVIKCATAFVPGLGTLLAFFAGTLKYASIGISLNGKFTQSLTILTLNGNTPVLLTVSTIGHFYMDVGFGLPANFFGLANKNSVFANFLGLNVLATVMLDFGNQKASVSAAVATTSSYDGSTDGNTFVQNMINNMGAELTVTFSGSVSLNFNTITHGLLPNLSMSLGQATFIMSTGSGNNSGLNAGFYFYESTNLDFLSSLLSSVSGFFAKVLNIASIAQPVVNVAGSFGFFLQTGAAGFEFTFDTTKVACYYNFTTDQASCNFGGRFLSMLLNAGMWAVKEVDALYGNVLKDFGILDKDFNVVENFIGNVAGDAAGVVVKIADSVASDISALFGDHNSTPRIQRSGYSDSCSSCSMVDDGNGSFPKYLQCSCQNGKGSSVVSKVDLSQCFTNAFGVFTWMLNNAYPNNYYQTCLFCSLTNTEYSCICKMGSTNGFSDSPTSANLYNYVGNINGQLTC